VCIIDSAINGLFLQQSNKRKRTLLVSIVSFDAVMKMHCPFYRFFTKMPSEHYMVEAHLLLGVAAEDIPHADEIRTILKV
jgi:hypothetical protein